MRLADWGKMLPLGAIALYGVGRVVVNSARWLVTSVPRDINYATPVVGLVTKRYYNRGQTYVYLNDDGMGSYTFYDFRPAHAPLPHAALDTAQLGALGRHGLMPLLQKGDSVVKRANDSLLAIVHENRRTYWVCLPLVAPASPAP